MLPGEWLIFRLHKNTKAVFSAIFLKSKDEERLILARGRTCFVILNAYPYNPGHLMVAPFRHTAEYDLLSDDRCPSCTGWERKVYRF